MVLVVHDLVIDRLSIREILLVARLGGVFGRWLQFGVELRFRLRALVLRLIGRHPDIDARGLPIELVFHYKL